MSNAGQDVELKFLYLNARSIMNKFDDLMVTVEDLRPDIIGITESWAYKDVFDSELSIEGYVLFRSDRGNCEASRGGGVLMYVREWLSPVEFSPETSFPEHVWCSLKKEGEGKEILVGVCYRSGSAIYGTDNNVMARDLIRELKGRCVVLMGDFNYAGIDWEGDRDMGISVEAERFKECVEENFFTQLVDRPTRDGNILDLVLCNEPNMVGSLEVIDCLATSDHNMITWTAHISSGVIRQGRVILDYRKADFDAIRAELRDIDWGKMMRGNTEEAWVKFKEIIQGLERKHVPVRRETGRKQLWMTGKAMRAVRRKRKIYARYRDGRHPACVEANKMARTEIKKARKNFETKLAQNIRYDSKSFFAYVRSKSKARVKTGSLKDDNGKLLEKGGEVAEEFSEYFGSVFSKEDLASIPELPREEKSEEGGIKMEITFERVRKILRRLRADKAPGVDELSPRILLHIQDEICLPLCILFEKSMEEGKVPEDWKRANIVPIYKAGSRNRAENYRPVSLTSQVCKLFETLIRDVVVEHLESSDLLNTSQHGFRKGRSCMSNLLTFLDKITEGIDKGDSIDGIFFDFAKAFDKVPHERLLRKIERFGIGGKLLAWIREWLTDRWQRVGVGGCWSEWRRVWSGVPQGSVLGPVLFLMFIDDLDDGLMSRILKFADDTKIFGKVDCHEDRNRLQSDLDKLVEWADRWQMSFNVGKCKVMHLGRRNEEWNYVMSQQRLKAVGEERDLGVTLTDDLKVSGNCRQAYNKANRMLGLLARTVKFRKLEVMVRLYKSLVRPHLEYCAAAWSPHYCRDRELLERIQHRFSRLVPGMREVEYGVRLERLGLMTLEERRNRSDLVEVYKISRGLTAIPMESLFELDCSGRTRGHSLKLRKQRARLDVRKFCFSQRVVDRWNGLDDHVVLAGSVDSFKTRLSKYCENKIGWLKDP